MGITWILTANASRARVFEVGEHGDTPAEVADFANPGGRAHERDLTSDAAGRYYARGERQQGHAASPHESAGQHETDRFAESLRDYLAHAHAEHRFGQLWIAAAPAFLGLMRLKMPESLRRAVELEIPKDYTTEQARDLFRDLVDARAAKMGGKAPG